MGVEIENSFIELEGSCPSWESKAILYSYLVWALFAGNCLSYSLVSLKYALSIRDMKCRNVKSKIFQLDLWRVLVLRNKYVKRFSIQLLLLFKFFFVF